MNLVRTKIPPVLLEAMADPYARPPGKKISCETLIMLVAPLDLALGEDVDRRPPEEDEDLMDRGKRMAGSAAFRAMASAAQDLIPMRGWVRKLSGAEKHDKLVQRPWPPARSPPRLSQGPGRGPAAATRRPRPSTWPSPPRRSSRSASRG